MAHSLYTITVYPLELAYKYLYIFLSGLIGSYGLALMGLSVVSTLIYHPIKKWAAALQSQEVHVQRVMAPQLAAIKAESTGAERLRRINHLYKRYAYHPIKSVRSSLGILIQVPFLIAAYNMIVAFEPISGLPFGPISDLGRPDALLAGLNFLPFLMTAFNIAAIYTGGFSGKERRQALLIAVLFLALLYTAPSALLIYWTTNNFFLLLENLLKERLPKTLSMAAECPARVLRSFFRFLWADKLLAVSLFLPVFTFCVYGPIELFLTNAQELWFDFEVTIINAMITGFLVYGLLSGLGQLLPERPRRFYALFMFGLGLAFYIQGSFMQRDYGLLDGRDIDWHRYAAWGLINAFIWLFCLALPFMLQHFKRFRFNNSLKAVTFIIIVTQCVTMYFYMYSRDNWRNRSAMALSTENIFTLSPNKNLIIFVLDAMDVAVFDETLAAYPELRDSLMDFTYYHDSVGMYPDTVGALPHVLTGLTYKNETSYSQYITEAYDRSPVMRALVDQNFDVFLKTDNGFVSPRASYVGNLKEKPKLIIENRLTFLRMLYQFVAIKFFPHSLKRHVWIYSNDFERVRGVRAASFTPLPPSIDDVGFYKALRQEKLARSSRLEKGAFKFYHLWGTHHPMHMNELTEAVPAPSETSPVRQTRGALRIVEEYIRLLKQIDLYESAMIVILADHGDYVHDDYNYSPSLLIKNAHEHHPFAVSEAPVSYADLAPTYIEYITGTKLADSNTVYDWSEGQSRLRPFLYYANHEIESTIIELEVSGSGENKSAKRTGRLFTAEGEKSISDPYHLGKTLYFTSGNRDAYTMVLYFTSGVANPKDDGVRSIGKRSEMAISLAKVPETDLAVDLTLDSFINHQEQGQTIIFYANGERLAEVDLKQKDADKSRQIRFIIPKRLITEPKLSLVFEFPKAISPSEWGGADRRVLAVVYREMVINELKGASENSLFLGQ